MSKRKGSKGGKSQSRDLKVAPWKVYPQVNLNNFFSIKKIIDDALVQFVQTNGLKQVNLYNDVRMALTILATIAGLLSQFYFKFPKDRIQLIVCVAAYLLLSGLGSLYEWWNLRGFVCRLRTSDSSSPIAEMGLNSTLKPMQRDWEVTMKVLDGNAAAQNVEFKTTLQITDYFDQNGKFSRRAFDRSICNVWAHFMDEVDKKQR